MCATNTAEQRGVLMVAFHFPPFAGSSGVQRTLRFCQYLPDNGWSPVVLTVKPHIHGKDLRVDDTVLPASARVVRSFALDAARHLGVAGRYFRFSALPDRWVWWLLGALPSGLRVIRRHRLRLIWSTYPIATAHIIGWALHRLSGLPWVADFRDPMVEVIAESGEMIPKNKTLRIVRTWIERKVARHASRMVFCTDGARRMFLERYPDVNSSHCVVIPNGYDENAFHEIERDNRDQATRSGPLLLLHSGVLYYSRDRDPTAFLDAIAGLLADDFMPRGELKVVFRASGSEEIYRRLIRERNLVDVVELKPSLPYKDALQEMMCADGLLLFQGKSSNPAIPAKLYEYIRARRPILGLVDKTGETSKLLTRLGFGAQVPLDDASAIRKGLETWLPCLRDDEGGGLSDAEVRKFSRKAQTETLAVMFEQTIRQR